MNALFQNSKKTINMKTDNLPAICYIACYNMLISVRTIPKSHTIAKTPNITGCC